MADDKSETGSRRSSAGLYRNVQGVMGKQLFYDVPVVKSLEGGRLMSASVNHFVVASAPIGTVTAVDFASIGTKASHKRLMLHSGGLTDMEHSDHYQGLLATCGDEGGVSVSYYKKKDDTTIFELAETLKGHERRCQSVGWHPCASNILCTAGNDNVVKGWDVETGKCFFEGSDLAPWQCIWLGPSGAASSLNKDRILNLWDFRAGNKPTQSGETPLFTANKPCRMICCNSWAGSDDYHIATVGYEGMGEKWLKIMDPRNSLSKPLSAFKLAGSGTASLHWDIDSGLLFVSARGEPTCQIYHFDGEKFSENTPVKLPKGASNTAFIKKRAVHSSKNEIARAYRSEFETKSASVVSFIVSRRTSEYAAELFDQCEAGEPALTAEEWLAGETKPPKTVKMKAVGDLESQTDVISPRATDHLKV